MAAAIQKMDGVHGRAAWSWIFILEGVASIIFGFACYFLLPRSPATAYFLTPADRAYIGANLRRDKMVAQNEADDAFKWSEVRAAFRRPHVWFLGVAGFFNGATLSGLAL